MFYWLCYFNFKFPLYIFLFFFWFSKGLKFKAHPLYAGTCQPALPFLKKKTMWLMMKSFCWSKITCAKLCVYIPLSMLWILTVHKKKKRNIKENLVFLDAFPPTKTKKLHLNGWSSSRVLYSAAVYKGLRRRPAESQACTVPPNLHTVYLNPRASSMHPPILSTGSHPLSSASAGGEPVCVYNYSAPRGKRDRSLQTVTCDCF